MTTPTTRQPATIDQAIRDAIEYADSVAGSDAEFAQALRARYFEHVQAIRPEMVDRRREAPELADPSKHIRDDPRYLRNLRSLAHRHLANERIIGGEATSDYPDCVAVGSDQAWGCTGTLIAPNVVLTAGHCVGVATRIYIGTDVTQPGRIVRVSQRIQHPAYHTGTQHNDLTVLVLAEQVDGVEPRQLADGATIDNATDGRAVGFGATEMTGKRGYGVKRMVDVAIASPSCSGSVGGQDDNVAYGCDLGLELIAGKPALMRDTCRGDSGGPFYVQNSFGDWQLAAATSRATDSAPHSCGDGGVYVRVDKYVDWIRDAAGRAFA